MNEEEDRERGRREKREKVREKRETFLKKKKSKWGEKRGKIDIKDIIKFGPIEKCHELFSTILRLGNMYFTVMSF